MNGERLKLYKIAKARQGSKSQLSQHKASVDLSRKHLLEECAQKEQSWKSSSDIEELKKRPDHLKQLLDTAIQVERGLKTIRTYELNFSINYTTSYRERIVITGKPEFLGNWDPLKGLMLEWNLDNIWRANIIIGEGMLLDFEYKYICIKPNGLDWESGPNRILSISHGVKRGSSLVFIQNDIWQLS